MKNVMDVLRGKEQEVFRVRKEVDALRITARLLSDEGVLDSKPHSRVLEMPDADELLDLTATEPS